MMPKLVHDLRKLLASSKIRYLISGGISFIVEYGLFTILMLFPIGLFIANSVSFLTALLTSFILHKTWSFSGDHKLSGRKQVASYATLAIVNLMLTNVVIGVLVHAIHVPPSIGKVLSIGVIVVWNYFIMSRLIFKK